MTDVTAVFFDVGGVLLTNGWDRRSRRATIEEFGLDWEEFRDRHEFVAHDFETGEIDIDAYLHRTVFYRQRAFTSEKFFATMKAQSIALPGSLEVVAELSASSLFLATLNNESRELNEHRIEAFGLRRWFNVFLSSCYVGVKKPDRAIYRLAFQITQRPPQECLFIDDRPLNVECAIDEGMQGILFERADQLRSVLVGRSLLS